MAPNNKNTVRLDRISPSFRSSLGSPFARSLGVLGISRHTPGGTDLSTSSVNNRGKDAGVELRVLGGTPISARAFLMRVIAKLFILQGDASSTANLPV